MAVRSIGILALVASAIVAAPGRARGEGSGAGGNAKAEACEEDYQRDDFDSAQRDCQDSIHSAPSVMGPYIRLAAIDIATKKLQDALAVTDSAARLATDAEDKVQIERYRGLALYELGQTAQAMPLLLDVAKKHPEAFDVQLCIGKEGIKTGDGALARTALERYFQDRPDKLKSADHDVRYLLAAAYVLEGSWQKAREQVDLGLREQPDDIGFKLLESDVYKGEGQWAQAANVLEPILPQTTGSRHALIAYKLATCFAQMPGRKADAVAAAHQYLAVFPRDPKGYVLLGDVFTTTGDYAQALTSYQTAQSFAPPHDVAILEKIARTDTSLGKLPDAAKTLEEAAAQAPDDRDVLPELGDAYIDLGQWKQAIATLEHLVSLKPPRISEASDLLGRAYIGAERLDDAQAAYQVAYDRSRGGDGFAVLGLVYVLNAKAIAKANAGDLTSAQTLLQQAATLDGDRLETNRNLAVVALAAGKPDDAAAPLAKVLAKVPFDLVANRLQGRLLLGKGDVGGAVTAYTAAMTQALRSGNPVAIAEVEAEQAAALVKRGQAGDLDRAITGLDDAVARPGLDAKSGASVRRARALAYAKRGLDELGGDHGDDAARDLAVATADTTLLTGTEPQELRFALGLADLEAGKAPAALEAFKGAQSGSGRSLPFLAPPYDKLGPDFFAAYAEYRTPDARARASAANVFAHLLGHAAGGEAATLRSLVRSSYEFAAWDAFQAGTNGRAVDLLKSAAHYVTPGQPDRILLADVAALDVAMGRGNAPAELEALGGEPPESIINLGVYWDRQHDAKKAYSYFKQALQRGAHGDHLGEWVAALEREFAFDTGGR